MLFIFILCVIAIGVSFATGLSVGWSIAAVVVAVVVLGLWLQRQKVKAYNRASYGNERGPPEWRR